VTAGVSLRLRFAKFDVRPRSSQIAPAATAAIIKTTLPAVRSHFRGRRGDLISGVAIGATDTIAGLNGLPHFKQKRLVSTLEAPQWGQNMAAGLLDEWLTALQAELVADSISSAALVTVNGCARGA
jgi:hypothetical protein